MANHFHSYRTKNKYNACKTVVNGIVFDSKKEAARYQTLLVEQDKGHIKALERQVRLELTPKMEINGIKYRASYYIVDFKYFDNRLKEYVYEDVKGYKGASPAYNLFKLKAKFVAYRYGIVIREI